MSPDSVKSLFEAPSITGDQRNRLEGVDLVNFSLESSWNTFLFGVRVDNVLDKKHFMFPQGLGSEIGRRLLFTAQNAF